MVTLTALKKRVAALEAKRSGLRLDNPQQAAMSRLLSTLREALPDDQPRFGEPGFAGPLNYRRHSDKVQALAGRIEAGEVSEEDRMVLDALPHDALGCLDMTAPELVASIGRVNESC